ncbi:TnsA endonuclease N-terminal domain-containing protein [Priestia taiwanensis]|uniref:Transposase n=1 Tax=Priestia taiwanensis TaxID=1347902 RepID=A0A917AYF8_9BACI|nr:TnsA endonuclease N-terminal domain-containing protein [Priestia taiwanensis]MBM7364461.1 putative transposase [Priestia taiwanensis]GGE81300.1 transposase [Priestia taiwanensis]
MIKDIETFLKSKGLEDKTIAYIKRIRDSEPARRVRSNGQNVVGTYPSKKMGLSIQFESKTLELPAIFEKEHDKSVQEYYDQPPSFKISYQINERNRAHLYTADFFVISEDWIGWEEWKTEDEIIKLSIQYPERYQLDEKGLWRCPPAEQYAENYGLSFRVKISKDLNMNYVRNIKFLEDYLLKGNLSIEKEKKDYICKVISENPGITIRELLEKIKDFQVDNLYIAFILGDFYMDIEDESIPELSARLYISKEYKDALSNMTLSTSVFSSEMSVSFKVSSGEKIIWDGVIWDILNAGNTSIVLINDEKETIEVPIATFEYLLKEGKIKGISRNDFDNKELEVIKRASPLELERANERFTTIQPYLNGKEYTGEESISERTIWNWIRKYRSAEKKYGSGYVGLLSEEYKKGNRTQRIDDDVQVLMETYIKEKYENIRQSSMKKVYLQFCQACMDKGYDPSSYYTFTKKVKETPRYDQVKKRKGPKAAYAFGEFFHELWPDTPRHGDRIFEICHLDHTELDIELRCSVTDRNLGRPWATFLVDAFSRRVLATYISYDPPSYRSCMMVLRECVKRYSRFPSTIVVDGGKEFESVYFETLLTRNRCVKFRRPAAKARFGNVIERLFGTTNEMFINNLMGNTQIMKNVRQVVKEINPKNTSIWTLEDFVRVLNKWTYEIYDQTEHTGLGISPHDMYEQSVKTSGAREIVRVAYDETFKTLTLPTTKKGTAKVLPGYGVKINRIYYWSPVLRNGLIENSQVFVRYDPFNMGIAYAFINNRWIELESEKFNIFKNRSEKEVNIAFEELKRRTVLSEKKQDITIKMLAEFLNSIESEELLLSQRLKDRAMRNLYVIEGGKSKSEEVEQEPKVEKVLTSENIRLVVNNQEERLAKNDLDILNVEFESYEGL